MSDGQTLLISGGASGLGLALAHQASQRGWRVAIADLHDNRGEAALRSLAGQGAEAMFLRCDVRRDADIRVAVQRVVRRWGKLDVLVNNAGVATTGLFEALSDDDWLWQLDTNLLGTVRACRAAISEMQRQGYGHLVNVASLDALVAAPGQSCYAATSAALLALSETLRHELAPLKIDVSVVLPPRFRSSLGDQLRSSDPVSRARFLQAMQVAEDNTETLARLILDGIERKQFMILNDEGQRLARRKRWRPRQLAADMLALARRIRR